MQDDNDSETEVKQIDSSSKPAAKSRPTRKTMPKGNRALKVPEIGKKRRRGGSGQDSDAEADGLSDHSPAAQKKRRVGSGKASKVVPIAQPKAKVKKPPQMPTVYKRGKWNPDIELIEVDPGKESKDDSVLTGCCTRCNNRNVHRAAMTGNSELLRRCILDKKKITNLNAWWSPEVKKTALEILLEKGDPHLLETLLHPKL